MHWFAEKSAYHIFRLTKLINDLLDVTKINAGKLSYNLEPFNFKKMLVESVECVQHNSPNHQIILENAPEITYNGDRFRLEQVLNNFLSNAVKYSPDGKKLSLIAKQKTTV